MSRKSNLLNSSKYFKLIREVEKKEGIPEGVLFGLLDQESSFNPDIMSGKIKSKSGAIGIAQFMPETAKDFNLDPTNIKASIRASGKYLSRLNNSHGNWNDALTAYNWGTGNVSKFKSGKRKDIPNEAFEYASRVKERAKLFTYKDIDNKKVYESKEKSNEPIKQFTPPISTEI
ncbi:MAG: transglycosylase SLT domain-containing protein, partial [Chlamydiia bacterium]|nr:transglycosylase SLT domain-containing protein [Chlamydiia bacterium]